MAETPAQFVEKLLSPKSRFSYALWTVLLFNGIAGSRKGLYDSVYFWLYGVQAIFFGLVWFITTLSRLREFGWSLWWIIPFTLTWLGLLWIFWWDPGRVSIAVLALWFVLQSILLLKNGRHASDEEEAEKTSA